MTFFAAFNSRSESHTYIRKQQGKRNEKYKKIWDARRNLVTAVLLVHVCESVFCKHNIYHEYYEAFIVHTPSTQGSRPYCQAVEAWHPLFSGQIRSIRKGILVEEDQRADELVDEHRCILEEPGIRMRMS